MVKYATNFQLALHLSQGYNLVDWSENRAGLYLKSPTFEVWHNGRSLLSRKPRRYRSKLAASGTREELEALVKSYGV